ncbi:type 1 glutamine amidotransferase [Tritonibacter scottomollicae]|uniref:Type 1 glutamine amidotransferase n=1 Tax=Tritonibacter scottomollicae TaxID=483013 RepID=A0ABZ0HMI4_TRISK|nr:type 1 glutamine amidotransferase [Tritonibacter scottomollicae]WOI35259.1 type 1 glutamine amidotransferase [Tritonibacter scottomollicae]
MRIAILMTNTDDSAFAHRHPKDGAKFTALVQMARPHWSCDVFAVKDDIFPEDISRYDGVMITGSPASTRSGAPWVDRLLALIRQIHDRKIPLFGACFGHQAIALALGGRVDDLPGGWVHGRTENHLVARPEWAAELPDVVSIYGSHVEYVHELPKGADPLMTRDGHSTGFTLGRHIATTQHHPEMTHDFICALTEELRTDMEPQVHARALDSLQEQADQPALAEAIARFFEAARVG